MKFNTWSIVAVDLTTGTMGVAVASCVPNMHGDALAAIVPGKGIAVIQAHFMMENRNQVYEMLKAGKSAREIIEKVSNEQYDQEQSIRQYGVITIKENKVKVEAFSGADNPAWYGSLSDENLAVTIQGNTLESEDVIKEAFKAFKEEISFTDKLMSALEAGSRAGGDKRCNNKKVKQTAATAFILATRAGDAPYATNEIGITDMGKENAPWLCLSTHEKKSGENPVKKLRGIYDEWRNR